MTQPDPHAATRLLEEWRAGSEDARERLLELVYSEMRIIARRLMKQERRGHTLQPTAVVNEACVRLLGASATPATSRFEFLGLAARVMRQVLVDHARRRDADRRGGDWQRVSISSACSEDDPGEGLIDAIDLDAALQKLALRSPRQAQVAELRYFGDLSIEETAAVMGIGPTTVKTEWTVARLWLARELGGTPGAGPGP